MDSKGDYIPKQISFESDDSEQDDNQSTVQKTKIPIRNRALKLLVETKSFTFHTFRLSRTFIPLTLLLASDEDITIEQLSDVLDDIFKELYEHPVTYHSRNITNYLRKNNMLPNEKTTEKLIQYVIDQVILRSPINVPEVVIREFWIFFNELFSEPELKGLVELNLDIVRLVLKTYEPLLVEIINLLKETKRITKDKLKTLLQKVRVIRYDLLILRRQIKAIRYVKPFFQTDPKDFGKQAKIVAQMVREFGPLFIKIAQVAAANSDFLPDEISKELKVFQEDVSPMSAEDVIDAFQESFGKSPEQLYFGFNPSRPIKSGSIGCVYLAKKPVIQEGKEVLIPVILKIGRHRLDREFLMGKTVLNLTILSSHYWAPHSKLAPFLEAMQDQVDEFIKGFQRELDFLQEASIQDRFYKRGLESIVWKVPKVYRASARILEMEYVSQAENIIQTLTQCHGKTRAIYAREIAARFVYTILLHVLVYKEFHGDLHPGNILINKTGELFLIDWGNCVNMHGKWKPFWEYVLGALIADVGMLAGALIQMSSEPVQNKARQPEIESTLLQTLGRKNVTPLNRYFIIKLIEEGGSGLYRRTQVVMHLMSNTQHLGLVIKSEYLHLVRSLSAMFGTYYQLYENLPKYLIPVDIIKSISAFPLTMLFDRMAVTRRSFYQDVVKRLLLPSFFKSRTEEIPHQGYPHPYRRHTDTIDVYSIKN